MLPINIEKDNLTIKSTNEVDLKYIFDIINESEYNVRILGLEDKMDFKYIKDRYIESLVNSMEYFCSIFYDNVLIGFLRGRLEFKGSIESWMMLLLIKEEYRNRGIGSKVIGLFEETMYRNYNVNVYNVIVKESLKCDNFWSNNGYSYYRQLNIEGNNVNSYIYIKEGGKRYGL